MKGGIFRQCRKKMNLYIFNEICLGTVYGIGTYIRELSILLKNSAINVCVVNLWSDKPQIRIEEVDGIKHWFFPVPIQGQNKIDQQKLLELYYHNVMYLIQLHIKESEELIFHFNFNQKGRIAEELKKTFECKVITTIHYFNWCFSLFGNVSRLKKILLFEGNYQQSELGQKINESYRTEKTLFELSDQIICLSEDTQQILQFDYQIKPEKIKVIYNGLKDRNLISDRHILLQKYHLSDIHFFIFVGRLEELKGLSYALRAFKTVLNKNPDCHFFIVGEGDFRAFMKECEDIWMKVTWTGRINQEKLYDLYSIADIGILPSLTEQCNYVAIEMMMHGLPMITSACSGLREMVEDGITGFQVPVIEYEESVDIDTDLLAEKMLFLLQHPDERQRMGANARKRYEKVYSADIFRQNMLDFYHSLYE